MKLEQPEFRGLEFVEYPLSEMPEAFLPVHRYWQKIKEDRFAPTWSEFDMMQISPDLLPSTLVKDVEREPLAFRFRYYGSSFVRLRNREYTGKTVDDMVSKPFSKAISRSLQDFIIQEEPRYYLLERSSSTGLETIQKQIRLPISNDGKSITNVVSIIKHVIEGFDYTNLQLDGDVLPYFGSK